MRMWGGLTWINDHKTEITKDAIENVEMNLWSKGLGRRPPDVQHGLQADQHDRRLRLHGAQRQLRTCQRVRRPAEHQPRLRQLRAQQGPQQRRLPGRALRRRPDARRRVRDLERQHRQERIGSDRIRPVLALLRRDAVLRREDLGRHRQGEGHRRETHGAGRQAGNRPSHQPVLPGHFEEQRLRELRLQRRGSPTPAATAAT